MSQLSLQAVVEKAGTSIEELDVPCPEEKFLELADFCNPWNIVGLHLKLKQTLIDDIDRDCRTTEEKKIKTVQKWKEAFAFKATYRAFVEALMSCGRVDSASEVCKEFVTTRSTKMPRSRSRSTWHRSSKQLFVNFESSAGKTYTDNQDPKIGDFGHHAATIVDLTFLVSVRIAAGGASRMYRIDKSLHTTDTCIISCEDGESIKMPCGHAMISQDYLMEYCRSEIHDKKYEIHCPYCNAEWTIDVLAKYGGADRRELTFLEEGFSVNFCDQSNDITQCPGCSSYCTRVDTDKNSMLCRICTKSKGRTYRFCFECNNEWKNGSNETFCGNKDCGSANEQLK